MNITLSKRCLELTFHRDFAILNYKKGYVRLSWAGEHVAIKKKGEQKNETFEKTPCFVAGGDDGI